MQVNAGGYGTLEELLEVITWAQLGIHDKPVIIDLKKSIYIYRNNHQLISIKIPILQVGLVDVDGYFNSLLSFIDKAVEEGFISPNARHIIVSAPTAKELVKKLEVINLSSLLNLVARKQKLNIFTFDQSNILWFCWHYDS